MVHFTWILYDTIQTVLRCSSFYMDSIRYDIDGTMLSFILLGFYTIRYRRYYVVVHFSWVLYDTIQTVLCCSLFYLGSIRYDTDGTSLYFILLGFYTI